MSESTTVSTDTQSPNRQNPTAEVDMTVDPSDFERAFAEVEPEILAVPTEDLMHITVDVRFVAVNTIARLPRIQELRDDIVEQLPRFDVGLLARLKTYALAAVHAYFRHQMSAASPAEVAELAAIASERRSVLLADVKALVAHGLMDGAPLAGLAGAVGYRNVAYDLLTLRNMLVDVWPEIAQKTVLTADDLEQDAAIASRLLMAEGAKSVTPMEPTETARVRDQAFSLFVGKYDQVRRAVTFVRWEQDDADDYAPSLYAGRGSRKTQEEPVIDAPPATNATGVVLDEPPAPEPAPDTLSAGTHENATGPATTPFVA